MAQNIIIMLSAKSSTTTNKWFLRMNLSIFTWLNQMTIKDYLISLNIMIEEMNPFLNGLFDGALILLVKINMIVLMNSIWKELGIGIKKTHDTKEILKLDYYLLVTQALSMLCWLRNSSLGLCSIWIIWWLPLF